MNIVIIRGRLSSEPTVRALQSGSVLVSLEVTTPDDGAGRSSVPVAWFDPPRANSVAAWASGDEVVAVGVVRRRFYRSGGGTQSRTEVVARSVVKAASSRSVARLVDEATRCLGEAAAGALPSE
ncbi:MAG: hypothetical protein RI900_2830 [Actinomycetota bacterium]